MASSFHWLNVHMLQESVFVQEAGWEVGEGSVKSPCGEGEHFYSGLPA